MPGLDQDGSRPRRAGRGPGRTAGRGGTLPVIITRGPARDTVAVTSAAAGLPAAIHAAADAAGVTVAVREVPSRAAGAALVESGAASAAVAGDRTVIWKSAVDKRLGPVLTTALAEVTIGRRAAAMGLTGAQAAALLAPARPAACSLSPPTAPIFMPLRTALTSVPARQVAAAMILMIASTAALMRVGGRVYRGAVLRMGQRVRIREAWREV